MINQNTADLFRILVIDDNPKVHEDFRKILVSSPDLQKDALAALDEKIFSDEKSENKSSSEYPSYDVEFASQGQEGLELIKKATEIGRPFSLMFVDIRMPPGWDGIETIQQIWKVDPWIQTVICTAYSDYSWMDMIKILGTKDNLVILKKPFDVVEVRQFALALTRKWQLNNEAKKNIVNLEETVRQRTIELERSLTLIRATLESTADGILVVNSDGEVVDYNKKFLDMWGVTNLTLRPGRMNDFLSSIADKLQDPDAFLAKVDYLNKHPDLESIDEVNFKNNKYFERYSKPYRVHDKVIGRVWSFRDITETKKLQEALVYHATHDKLTKLPNRRLLYDRIKQAMAFAKRTGRQVAVMLFDIDRFKMINDSLSHTAGDFALRIIAARVSGILREIDTIARLGGDEFVVSVYDIENEAQIEIIANKILTTIKNPFKINKFNFSLKVSMGISIYPEDGTSVDDLLQKADSAMYRVKKQGGNGFKFCEPDESARTLKLLSLENDLRNAIENNELVLHYQPLIDLPSGNITGVEALIRWNHPTLGLLMPVDFLQIAEESGLIVPMGEWVLRKACLQNKLWQEEKLPFLKIAVNVSSTQLKMPLFSESISNILKETHLDPQYLEIELTETVIIENPELMLKVLKEIKKLGVELVMDDFGTGYSSLSYLKRFPFNKLKIDRSFVQNIGSDEDDISLIQSIIVMAGNLRLKVVAEGVETEKQLSLLSDRKCDQIQGYFFSRPLDAENLSRFIRNHPSFQRSQ